MIKYKTLNENAIWEGMDNFFELFFELLGNKRFLEKKFELKMCIEALKLYELSVDLKQLFIDCEQEPWQAITIIVDEKGSLKMDYDYADWLSSPYTPTPLMNYFEYKYLGKMPEDKEEEKLFKEMEEYQSKFNK